MTFIAQTKDSLWSLDLFRCESILLRSHWVLVIMDVFSRRIIGFGAEREYIDGVCICRMFNDAIAGQPLPKRVSTATTACATRRPWGAESRRFLSWLANSPPPVSFHV